MARFSVYIVSSLQAGLPLSHACKRLTTNRSGGKESDEEVQESEVALFSVKLPNYVHSMVLTAIKSVA